MKIPKITGIIDRRILINYQVEPEVLEKYLPPPFRPKLVKGKGMAGICLIRLKEIRPKGLPKQFGISSENGAHRIAVEWTENGRKNEGVFIPRRDTSSVLNALAGGRIFPGRHRSAKFRVKESEGNYEVAFSASDGVSLSIKARESAGWSSESVFENLTEASAFFEKGAVGYSPGKQGFDGLELKTLNWEVSALETEEVFSDFFADQTIFPAGSVKFDHALLMRNISHEWIGLERIKNC